VETAGGIQIGATEACLIMYGNQFVFAFLPKTNESAGMVLNFKDIGIPLDFEFTIGSVIAFSTFVLSLQYNVGNFYVGFKGANNKGYALACILPFIYVPTMVYLASIYSQFWSEYPSMFLFGVGILITNVTGTFNLASSAKYKFNPFFIDVLAFGTILYLDYNRKASEQTLITAYLAIIAIRFCLYIAFMANMIK
jgi:hypothetical protein